MTYGEANNILIHTDDYAEAPGRISDAISKILSMATVNAVSKETLLNALKYLANVLEKDQNPEPLFYIRDKATGRVHGFGEDQHDDIWVDSEGTLHYHNLQNGDGCSYQSILDHGQGYEFCPMEYGQIDSAYREKYMEKFLDYEARRRALENHRTEPEGGSQP